MTIDEPPIRCSTHLDEPSHTPCGGCADAREHHREWDRQRRLDIATEASSKAQEKAELRRLDIEQCHQCDEHGYYGGLPCHHDPLIADRARRGLAACREALND